MCSSDLIGRRAALIAREVVPKAIVVHWSYLNRREKDLYSTWEETWNDFYQAVRDPSWPDVDFQTRNTLPKHIQLEISTHSQPIIDDLARQQQFVKKASEDQDIENTLEIWDFLDSCVDHSRTKIVYSTIPLFSPLKDIQKFKSTVKYPFIELNQIDRARDSHHYDIKTANVFVDKILESLDS